MFDFSQNEWGLVLSGGGGKGAYQAGVFRALMEKGIQDYITAVSGASVGALNLVMFASGQINLAQDIWRNITPDQFLSLNEKDDDGVLSRKGIEDIISKNIDLNIIRENEKRLYVSVTERMDYDDGIARYFSLNYRPYEEIKKILLASSAMPIIYSPVEIDGKLYVDGGVKDNLPIKPLYIEGIRNFIVVGLSTETKINFEKYPDAKFLLIKPRKSIGDFWDGTLDFTSKGAKIRMEIGYIDAIRELEFYGRSDNDSRREYENAVNQDYLKIDYMCRHTNLEERIDCELNKINSLINKYL